MTGTALLRRNNPLSGVIENLFDDAFFTPTLRRPSALAQTANETWIPSVDLAQTEEGYLLRADLPGLTKEDIHLSVEDAVLTLSGERLFENKEDRHYDRVERAFGKFSRTFHLPSSVDGPAIKASFTNGVLTVEIPKAEQAKGRLIEIE